MAAAAYVALIGDELGYIHGAPSPHVIRSLERTTTGRIGHLVYAVTPCGSAQNVRRGRVEVGRRPTEPAELVCRVRA